MAKGRSRRRMDDGEEHTVGISRKGKSFLLLRYKLETNKEVRNTSVFHLRTQKLKWRETHMFSMMKMKQ